MSFLFKYDQTESILIWLLEVSNMHAVAITIDGTYHYWDWRWRRLCISIEWEQSSRQVWYKVFFIPVIPRYRSNISAKHFIKISSVVDRCRVPWNIFIIWDGNRCTAYCGQKGRLSILPFSRSRTFAIQSIGLFLVKQKKKKKTTTKTDFHPFSLCVSNKYWTNMKMKNRLLLYMTVWN